MFSLFKLFFCQSLPSTILDTNIELDASPTTFNIVAGGSMIVAMIVRIGRAALGKPIIDKIIISEIVPPPIGTAVISRLAIIAVIMIWKILDTDETSVPNKYTRNIILKTLPITEPSLWNDVPNGIVVSAMSSETPIFLAHFKLAGIDAAEEHVDIEVAVAGRMFFQNDLTPFFPAAMNAYREYIIK